MIHFKTFLEEDAEELEKSIMEWLKKIGNGREIDRYIRKSNRKNGIFKWYNHVQLFNYR